MSLKLVVTTNVNGDVFELLLKNARYGVGRRSDNDLRIKETYISGYHAELVRGEKDEFFLSDLGSSNGTFLNGRRVNGREAIKAGDFIKFGILKVAVQEHTETLPKIVALKDRPEFSRKDDSNTSAISVERKTGNVATVGAGTASGETRAVETPVPVAKPAAPEPSAKDDKSDRLVAGLKSKADAAEKELSALRATLAEREKRLSEAEGRLDAGARLEKELKAREEELGKLRGEADAARDELKRVRSESEESSLRLAEKESESGKLSGELDGLREALESARAEAREAKAALASELAGIEKERKLAEEATKAAEREKAKLEKSLASLEGKHAKQNEELSALKSSLKEKQSELRVLAGEAEKGAVVASEIETLRTDLAELSESLSSARARETELLEEMSREEGKVSELEAALAEAGEKALRLEEQRNGERAAAEADSAELARIREEFDAFRRESENAAANAAEAATATSRTLEEELTGLRARLGEMESQAAERLNHIESAKKDNEAIAKERDALDAQLRELRASGDDAAAELADLRGQFAVLEAERDEWRQRESHQTGDLQAAKAEANELRLELRKAKDGSEKTLRELEASLRSRVAELETALSAERVRASDTGTEKGRLEESLAAMRVEMEGLREETAQLRFRNEEASRNSGRLQAELNREATERTQVNEALEASRVRVNGLVAEVEVLKHALEGKERESVEREQQFARSEGEIVQKLKRELAEAASSRDAAEEKAAKAVKEKQVLSGSFERLKEQLDTVGAELQASKGAGEEMLHAKGLLARRLEKAEASNSELAARIKEEALAALASRELIGKLETQIRENESESVRREREQVAALQADLSRASRRAAEDERRRRELEAEVVRTQEARKQAEERILSLEARLVEQEAETGSTRTLLGETEKARIELASRLAAESSLVATHARTVESLRHELAETISRFTASETALMAKHGEESDALLAELRSERTRREGLEADLINTREGLSEALRHAREEGAKAQARLLAEGNSQLSAVEDELSAAIRAREAVEESRSALEDELNEREEEIERLCERIESLENRLNDEADSRQGVLRLLDTTRAGFSETLRSGWERLFSSEEKLGEEGRARRDAEDALLRAREEIDRLAGEMEEGERRYQADVRAWEDRYETLRGEKLTLASEDADLRKIRDEIVAATAKRRALEDEIEKFQAGVKEIQSRQGELQAQRESLVAEREQLKATLNAARLELGILQKQCSESKDQESKYAGTIAASERRIQSLRKLEAEMEQAVERRRQMHQLSRSEVFSGAPEPVPTATEFSQEEFYRKLIAKLDLIDDLAKRYDNKWLYPKVSEQLGILKRSFLELLEDHSVQPFNLEPGTVVSITERKRIKLVPLQNGAPKRGNGSQSSLVVETVRPGYVYRNGAQDVIIRKAEVVVS